MSNKPLPTQVETWESSRPIPFRPTHPVGDGERDRQRHPYLADPTWPNYSTPGGSADDSRVPVIQAQSWRQKHRPFGGGKPSVPLSARAGVSERACERASAKLRVRP